jgi:glyceraldehyde 3-phosphate dehydrogenase
VVDFVCEIGKEATTAEVNAAFKAAEAGPMKGILGYTDEPLVSMDFKGDARSSIVDGPNTMVMGGNLLKVLAWYDNEWAYSVRCCDLAKLMVDKGL